MWYAHRNPPTRFYAEAPGVQGWWMYTQDTFSDTEDRPVHTDAQIHAPVHTHTWLHTHCPPPSSSSSFCFVRQSFCPDKKTGCVFFFFFLFFFSLNKNNLLSDVGSLIVVTGPKLKCGLIKACVCVWVCAHVLLTLIRPINSLSVTKSALAARQTQLPVKSVLLLLGLPEQCLDVCHGSNRNQAKLRLF